MAYGNLWENILKRLNQLLCYFGQNGKRVNALEEVNKCLYSNNVLFHIFICHYFRCASSKRVMEYYSSFAKEHGTEV